MTPEQIASYVGKPYRLGAEGPDAYDCRGLVRTLLHDYWGIHIPELPIDGLSGVWGDGLADGHWETVDKPTHGDPVIMRNGKDPHIGLWLTSAGAGVLHAWEGARQVVWTPAGRLRFAGFSRLTFVRVGQPFSVPNDTRKQRTPL